MSGETIGKRVTQSNRVARATSSFTGFTTVSSSLPRKTNDTYVNFYNGPVPAVREIAQEEYTSYCELHRNSQPNTPAITKTVFVKNMLAMILSIDNKAAILAYDETKGINSICHPQQVPMENKSFEIYFPRTHLYRGSISLKCRITTSISMIDIKRSLLDTLRKKKYFLKPTPLKAIRTGKAGWMYMAHPDLTYRREFEEILSPIIEKAFKRKIEFHATPEMETQRDPTNNNLLFKQRVLAIRCPYEEVQAIRQFLTEVFAPDTSYNIGFLGRYTFVPSKIMGNLTNAHLRSLLQLQKSFHTHVFWYIMHGITNINQECEILPAELPDPDLTQPCSQSIEDENENDEDMSYDQEEDTNDQSLEPPKEYQSLRMLMYNTRTPQGKHLIHAVYPGVDNTKMFVLCCDQHREHTLQFLHTLEETVTKTFVPTALQVYFGIEGTKPSVQDYPVLSPKVESYVDNLVELTSSNPQEEPNTSTAQMYTPYTQATHSNKRHHSGNPKTQMYESNLPSGFTQRTARTAEQKAVINETMMRLKQIEANDTSTQISISEMTKRLDQQGKDISHLGRAVRDQQETIDTIQETQVSQGKTIMQMHSDQTQILQKLNILVNRAGPNTSESLQGSRVGSK